MNFKNCIFQSERKLRGIRAAETKENLTGIENLLTKMHSNALDFVT